MFCKIHEKPLNLIMIIVVVV